MTGNRPGSLTLNEYIEVLNKQQERDTRMLDEQTRLRPLEELGVHLLHILSTGQVVLPNADALMRGVALNKESRLFTSAP